MIGIQKEELRLEQVITDVFRDFKGDEAGGQHAMRGFNFQVWHAVLEALRAYKTGNDYAVVLEWQQDVAVLNSSTAPTAVRFIQLKKNESSLHWKLANLVATPTKDEDVAAANEATAEEAPPDEASATGKPKKKPRKKKLKQSFLAKLYAHRRRFKALVQSRLEFASNTTFEIPDEAGVVRMLSAFDIKDLPQKIREELESKVRVQLTVPADEAIDFNDISLVVSDCPLNDAHKHLAGELAEMQLNGELKLSGASTMLAVLVIASYIHQRAGTLRFAKNLEELLARAVTRTDIDRYLAAANDARVSTEELVQEVIDRLNMETVPFPVISRMKRELSRACVDITNRAGPAPMLAARLKALYEKNAEYEVYEKVIEQFNAWYEDFQKLALPNAHLYKREYLFCLMSMIIQDANPIQQLPPVSTGAQPEDAK